jgi:hypothetical protein
MAKPVYAKIATVLSGTMVVFNIGAAGGVSIGDEASIYRDTEVFDPDSRESLGTVREVRLKFEVVHVQEKLAVGMLSDHFPQAKVRVWVVNVSTPPRPYREIVEGVDPADREHFVRVDIGEPVILESPRVKAGEVAGSLQIE